jgi:hypothetical protein
VRDLERALPSGEVLLERVPALIAELSPRTASSCVAYEEGLFIFACIP